MDWKTKCIPNWWIGIFFFVGGTAAFFQKEIGIYIGFSLIGLMIASFGFWIGAVGGGDVKLIAVLAGWVRSWEIGWTIFAAFVVAACIGIIQMIYQKRFISRMRAAFGYLIHFFHGDINRGMDSYKEMMPDTKPICFSICILAGYWMMKFMIR